MVFRFCHNIIPVLDMYKTTISILESNDFGVVSFVLLYIRHLQGKIKLIEGYPQASIVFNSALAEYFNKFCPHWMPILLSSTIFNPNNDPRRFLSPTEYDTTLATLNSLLTEQSSMNEIPETFNELSDYRLNRGPVAWRTELLSYLEARTPTDDLLGYWKRRSDLYPELSKLALGYLSIPTSSASCERLFSKTKRTLGFYRLSMTTSKVEASAIIAGNVELHKQLYKK